MKQSAKQANTSIYIDPKLKRKLKVHCAKYSISLTELINKILTDHENEPTKAQNRAQEKKSDY